MAREGKYRFTSWLFPLSERRCQCDCRHQRQRSGLGSASAFCKHFPLEIYMTLQSPPCAEMTSVFTRDEQRLYRVHLPFHDPLAWADYQNNLPGKKRAVLVRQRMTGSEDPKRLGAYCLPTRISVDKRISPLFKD